MPRPRFIGGSQARCPRLAGPAMLQLAFGVLCVQAAEHEETGETPDCSAGQVASGAAGPTRLRRQSSSVLTGGRSGAAGAGAGPSNLGRAVLAQRDGSGRSGAGMQMMGRNSRALLCPLPSALCPSSSALPSQSGFRGLWHVAIEVRPCHDCVRFLCLTAGRATPAVVPQQAQRAQPAAS
jgi:hypothetical protein